MEFEIHPGPLAAGDLIVIEVAGKLVPRRPDDMRPQWFVVLQDQDEGKSVPLKPFHGETSIHRARKYCALWRE